MAQTGPSAPLKFLLQTRARTLAIAFVPIVLTIAVSLMTWQNLTRLSETTMWVAHTQKVLTQAEQITRAAVDMETGLRGFLLAGQDNFLEPYVSGQARAFAGLEALRVTVSDNPPQVTRLTEAQDILARWQSDVADPAIALRREIGVDRLGETHHSVVLAQRIAAQITQMIAQDTLPDGAGQRRKVTAGDIMILVQGRSDLFAEIIRACKTAKLPIAGADRLKVGAELAVRDLAALLRFLDTPEDDQSLACALKSP